MPGKYWDQTKIIDGVSIAAPAIRTVLVFAFWNSEEDHHASVIPVLAIQANLTRAYKRPPSEKCSTPSVPADLTEDGWKPDGVWVDYDFLVIDDMHEYGLCEASLACASVNGHYEPVACPWPPDQDQEKLTPVIARVIEKAKEKEISRRQKRPTTSGAESA